jgi:hypothetical protein
VNYEAIVFWSMMLSKDLATCEQLLRGDPVDPERIDSRWLEFAAGFHLIRMDFYAVDLLHRRADLRALLRETA